MIVYFYFSLSILLAPRRRINFDIEVSNVWAIWLEGGGGMWGSVFFLGFGRGGTRGERYFRKMHGRRCWNSELFFHRLREVNGTYVYFGEGVLCWKNSFFFVFFGGFVLHIFQRIYFWIFFLVIRRPQAIPVRIFSFLLIFLFFLVFFLRLLKGIFFPLFLSSHLSSESSFFALFHILLLTECFLWFFGRIYRSYLFIHFYLFV